MNDCQACLDVSSAARPPSVLSEGCFQASRWRWMLAFGLRWGETADPVTDRIFTACTKWRLLVSTLRRLIETSVSLLIFFVRVGFFEPPGVHMVWQLSLLSLSVQCPRA